MKEFDTSNNILNIIKYGAVIPVFIFSAILTYTIVDQKNSELEKEINTIKTNYLLENKAQIKEDVKRVISSLNFEIENYEKKLKKILKEKVYEAHGIATNIYLDESNHEKNEHPHSKEHIFRTIKYALGGMRYNKDNRGYIFIDDINGTKLLQPTNTNLEGKNLFEFEDAKGYKFVKKIVKTIKNKTEDYDTYYWYKSKDDPTPYKKLSFYKYFEPYDVAIGTGEYLIDAENELKEIFLKRINNIKFGKDNYIFAFDDKGTYLSHFKKEKIGTDGFSIKDANGNYFIKDMVSFAKKNKEGYFTYIATSKPNGDIENRDKTSYVVYFDRWNWTIGTGFYLKEVQDRITKKESELKEKYKDIINKILILSLLVTVILLFMSFYASRIISNKFKMYKNQIEEEIEIKRIIEKSDNLICSRFKDNEIELIKNVENFEIKVQVSNLLQVLINILKNARDELAQKNSFERKLIFISTKKLSDKFIIKIKDNAGGISLENMDKIFEPYFTTKTNSNGTGIGLYMSMQIIEKMNGSLKVQNDEFDYEGNTYKGAEFIIELPFNI